MNTSHGDDRRRKMTDEMRNTITAAARDAVKEILSEQPVLTHNDATTLVRTTLHETLTMLGADPSKPLEMQKDFQHLRAWRESVATVKSRTIWAAVGVIVTGALGLVWLGIVAKLGLDVSK